MADVCPSSSRGSSLYDRYLRDCPRHCGWTRTGPQKFGIPHTGGFLLLRLYITVIPNTTTTSRRSTATCGASRAMTGANGNQDGRTNRVPLLQCCNVQTARHGIESGCEVVLGPFDIHHLQGTTAAAIRVDNSQIKEPEAEQAGSNSARGTSIAYPPPTVGL